MLNRKKRFGKLLLAAAAGVILSSFPVDLSMQARDSTVWAAGAESHHEAERAKGVAVRPGDTIGILAPGSSDDIKEYAEVIRDLEKMGYKVKIGDTCNSQYGYFAGTDSDRAAEVNKFFADDEVKAILCMRGGYGTARILDRLDYEMIAKHPKQFIGYSDITALHVALGERSNLSTIHGPMLRSFMNGLDKSDAQADIFLRGLKGELYPGELPLPEGRKLETVFSGEAEGVILGGNLAVLTSMVGTPCEMKGDGVLLLLEDVDEVTYRVDRMLWQLWESGLLSRVNGILIGDMIGAEDKWEEGEFHLEEILDHYARLAGKPMIKGVPVGHGKDNVYLPLGVHAVMRANADGTASLSFDEAALRSGF